jgi:non-lysosomal glucosylceramidase
MNAERQQVQADAAAMAGVPLGGIGTGCIEFGRDGRMRNITINNNRTVEDRIAVSPGAFVAVRAEQRGRVSTRLLQPESEIPFAGAGIDPGFTTAESMAWRGLYPRADYELTDPQFPVDLKWGMLSPVIPYDTDAATLPVVFFSVEMSNPGSAPINAAAMVNWENLCGCTADTWPKDRGVVQILLAPPPEAPEDEENAPEPEPPGPMGLACGVGSAFPTNAHGNYCLAAQQQDGVAISVRSWDGRSVDAIADTWSLFRDEGMLDNRVTKSRSAHCCAVCCSFRLMPGETRVARFVLTWFCPRFEVGGVDQGNGYALAHADARSVIGRALKYQRYFHDAVEGWHRRFDSSSLPRWLSRMLINNNHVLSTNSILTREGKFALFESPGAPWTGALDRRFHSSLGTLLLFPHLAMNELEQFAAQVPPEIPGRLYRYLGKLRVDDPGFSNAQGELMDLNAKFILMVYRDTFMTGRLTEARKYYDRLKQILQYVLKRDKNLDGLPEDEGFCTTYDMWKFYGIDSYSGSIWLAAIRAFAEIARKLDHPRDAEQCDQIFERACATFERRLWNPERGYYYMHDNSGKTLEDNEPVPHGCVSGQMVGQWYADFLALGCILPPAHITKALGAIYATHEHGKAVATWPALHISHYACLEITRGLPDKGLAAVQKVHKNIHVQKGRAFDQPLCWNLQNNEPQGWGRDRHFCAPSVWHVLYALQGFFLNVPEQQLWVRPHLPRGVKALSAPLVTPSGFGWLSFKEETEPGAYKQVTRVSFESPVSVQTLVLRVPHEVGRISVDATGPVGTALRGHGFGFDGNEKLVEIQLEQVVTITEPLQIRITQTG